MLFLGDNEDIMVHGEPIPPQILAEIFMRIDRKMTVGCICPMVSLFIPAPS